MPSLKTPALVLVGGFLGAGKTTLILYAAKLLARRGQRAAAIMNDQAADLVDTQLAQALHLDAAEVAGGCFCCRFSDMLGAANRLKAYDPDVIFAEPVGSCIDLSATILQPLRVHYPNEFDVAPLSVLVDPGFQPDDEDVAYLYRNQLDEADLVCVTKSDLYAESPNRAVAADFILSARTGDGVEAWLDTVLTGKLPSGRRVLEVDYTRYAEAEAALGWLNMHADVVLDEPQSPAGVAGPLLDRIGEALQPIAHLKIFNRTAQGYVKVSLVGTGAEPLPEGDLTADPSLGHELTINLRAVADPEELERIVRAAVLAIPGKVDIRKITAFRPAPPKPEYRMERSA